MPTTTPGLGLYRVVALVFAFILSCQAIWILTAEFSRAPLLSFPTNPQAATTVAANRKMAASAASFGLFRGDLYAEYALTYLSLFWSDNLGSADVQASETIERAREVADRALALAPHDARIWLVLASIDSRLDWLNRKAAGELRMSYYTGANEGDLMPLRLFLAVRSEALSDPDFQQLVRHDIRAIVNRKPELKSAILVAYRDALPIGQHFLEESLEEIDPTLLARIRPKG